MPDRMRMGVSPRPILRSLLASLRLRTKFLLSTVFVIAALTWIALLVVSKTVQDALNRTVDYQRGALCSSFFENPSASAPREVMSRKADLLATSAFLPTTTPVPLQTPR